MVPKLISSLLRRTPKPKILKPVRGFRGVQHHGVIDGIHYYESGPSDADTTVVFIHGFTLAASSFFHQVEHLDARGDVRCILMDLRGHGETGEVPFAELSVSGAADDVLRIVEQRCPNGELILVGHSLGGLIALNLARRLGPSRIRSLLLIATAIETLGGQGLAKVVTLPMMDKLREAVESAPEATEKYTRDTKDFLVSVLAPLFFNVNTTDYDLVEFYAELVRRTPMATFIGFFDDLQSHDELAAAAALQSIDGIVMVGDRDAVTPMSQAERICELWPRGQLCVVEGGGHMLVLEMPEQVNAALDTIIDGIKATSA